MTRTRGKTTVTEEIWRLLQSVPDPEIPIISIVDLGIVRDVFDEGHAVVAITPTYSGCPATEMIEQSVREVLDEAGHAARGREVAALPFLEFIAEVRGFKGAAAEARIAGVIGKMQLERVVNQRIETLSKGFKRRVGLAQALLHDPDVLILDEPTDGLDPNQKHHVREMISGMGKEKCIIISTHILEEVEAVCSRAIIIAKGKVLADGTPEELTKRGDGKLDVYFRKLTLAQEAAA